MSLKVLCYNEVIKSKKSLDELGSDELKESLENNILNNARKIKGLKDRLIYLNNEADGFIPYYLKKLEIDTHIKPLEYFNHSNIKICRIVFQEKLKNIYPFLDIDDVVISDFWNDRLPPKEKINEPQLNFILSCFIYWENIEKIEEYVGNKYRHYHVLYVATRYRKIKVLEHFLNGLELPFYIQESLIKIAIDYGHLETLKLLIEKYKITSVWSSRLLRQPSFFGYLHIIKYLVEEQNIKPDDISLLETCKGGNHIQLIEYYFTKGLKFNEKYLKFALEYKQEEVVDYFFKNYSVNLSSIEWKLKKEGREMLNKYLIKELEK